MCMCVLLHLFSVMQIPNACDATTGIVIARFVCVCVSQTLFQREVRFSDERIHDFHDHHAGGHRKPIELCPTKLSMVSSGYQG